MDVSESEEERMNVNQDIVETVRPAVNAAVDRAVHRADPDRFHQRVAKVCPYCETLSERLRKTFVEHATSSPAFKEAAASLLRVMDSQDHDS